MGVECSRGTRIIVVFTAAEVAAWEPELGTLAAPMGLAVVDPSGEVPARRYRHAVAVGALRRHVDGWAGGTGCPCCGGCLTLVDLVGVAS